MDVDPHVTLLREQRLTGVEAYADSDRSLAQDALRVTCGPEGVSRPRERNEEGVPLRVDLDAAVLREHLAQQTPVLGQLLRIGVAEFAQQSRRALDVREEERDSTARKLAHGLMMPRKAVVDVRPARRF
jgi:hypothetical protein